MKDRLTKGLAIGGTILVWLPVLTTWFFSLLGFFRRGYFSFDYLMPAELFFLFLAGGGLLLWAALRARAYRAIIIAGMVAAVALLGAGLALARVLGLDSGAAEPGGWQSNLVLGLIAGYSLALVVVGIGGALLVRDLFKPQALGVKPS